MKRAIFLGLIALLLLNMGLAYAASDDSGPFLGVKDLVSEQPTLLPSNIFYFLKKWKRDIKRTLTKDTLQKVKLELGFLNDIAAEIKTLESAGKIGSKGFSSAMDKYEIRIIKLKITIVSMGINKKSSNSDILLDDLMDKGLKHYQIFQELKNKDEKLAQKSEIILNSWNAIITTVFNNFESPESFKKRMEKIALMQKDDGLREFRVVSVLSELSNQLPETAQGVVLQVKNSFIAKLEGRLKNNNQNNVLKSIQSAAETWPNILQILDEIKEEINDTALKSQLNFVKSDLLQKNKVEHKIGVEKAGAAIELARKTLSELEIKLASSTPNQIPRAVTELLNQAKINFDQAEKLYADEEYGTAFGQANSASALVQAGIGEILKANGNESDIESLKENFDLLSARVQKFNLNQEEHLKLFDLISQAEKTILSLNTEDKNFSNDLQNARILLSQIEENIKTLETEKSVEQKFSGTILTE